MLQTVREVVAGYLRMKSIRRHRTRLGRDLAPKYSKYLDAARASASVKEAVPAEVSTQAEQFRKEGWAAFNPASSQELAASMWGKIRAQEQQGLAVWDADSRYALGDIYQQFPEVDRLFQSELGGFLRACYGANFKIFFGVCYKSKFDPAGASGSQLWHADGGPGTCINLMWCLSPVSRENGAMECLPWTDTLQIFESEKALRRGRQKHPPGKSGRDILCEHYEKEIRRHFNDHIIQPNGDSGLLFAFSNNLVHKGGYPQSGHERYVCVFHIYPSAVPTPFERYRSAGIAKTGSFPKDPAFQDNEPLPQGIAQ
ncbi:MAG: phytanoyl-CoA dioxygenase family protein [Pseudolabrys sp.]|nr:phytanoyl-CoA dioxygenase family protein [Pseudolabrys sp.]